MQIYAYSFVRKRFHNLINGERLVLKELQNNPQLMIKTADKTYIHDSIFELHSQL